MFTCLVLCLFRVFQAFLTTRIKMETSILSSLSYLIFLRGRALGPALGEGPAIPAPPPCCYCKIKHTAYNLPSELFLSGQVSGMRRIRTGVQLSAPPVPITPLIL